MRCVYGPDSASGGGGGGGGGGALGGIGHRPQLCIPTQDSAARRLAQEGGVGESNESNKRNERNESKKAQLRWYYRPCDCEGADAKVRQQLASKARSREVFLSSWTDENPVDSFLKHCYVLPRDTYASIAAEMYDDVFFCRERYCPVKRRFCECEEEIRRRDVKVLAPPTQKSSIH